MGCGDNCSCKKLPDPNELLYANIKHCARCGGDHIKVGFALLTNVMVDYEGAWTHWAMCPTNGQPILLKVTSSGES